MSRAPSPIRVGLLRLVRWLLAIAALVLFGLSFWLDATAGNVQALRASEACLVVSLSLGVCWVMALLVPSLLDANPDLRAEFASAWSPVRTILRFATWAIDRLNILARLVFVRYWPLLLATALTVSLIWGIIVAIESR
ncbi:MAG: hypothetical protein O7F17_03725 [Planctomycetota bacterium]|nr:hypothetical protein [Planctomycetota bacterium]